MGGLCGEREMDDEMEETFEEEFLAVEIDLDYEFDAARYFDFCRNESFLEAEEAERWFEAAGSYPPSPCIVKLNLREGTHMGNVNISPKSKDTENSYSAINNSDANMGPEFSALHDKNRGFTFYDHTAHDVPKAETNASTMASLLGSSTLMKPTASQLAKQNQRREVVCHDRFSKGFQKQSVQTNEKGSENAILHAAKRQKLDGGHLRKFDDLQQQFDLAHKVPKKSEPVHGNLIHAKLKLTIPREPELETAQRAQRSRFRSKIKDLEENMKSTAKTFRARPLNRKILEAPSLPLPQKSTPQLPDFKVFSLKTSDRARQHSSAVSSSSLPADRFDKVMQKDNASYSTQNGTVDTRRKNSVDALKEEVKIFQKFKARPLNKKIFSSKGDIGVFRNSKREATVPMEFNFSTDKRFQNNLPIELFNKLSLTSELQPNTRSQRKLPHPPCISMKGSKENTPGTFRQLHGKTGSVWG